MKFYKVTEKSNGIIINYNYKKVMSNWFTCKDEIFTENECEHYHLNKALFTPIETSKQNTYKLFGNRMVLNENKVIYL